MDGAPSNTRRLTTQHMPLTTDSLQLFGLDLGRGWQALRDRRQGAGGYLLREEGAVDRSGGSLLGQGVAGQGGPGQRRQNGTQQTSLLGFLRE